MHISTFGRSLVVLRTLLDLQPKAAMDAALEAMHTGMYAGFGGVCIESIYQSP